MKDVHTEENREEKQLITIIKRLFIGYSPEEIEDMIFHVFEDANLQSGDLCKEEKQMRSEFHIASRSILRILYKNPSLLKKITNL
ncbi:MULTISPECIES: hypothetical protein [unclassified Chryseobacterium]|uniref:hypothetical protein n=1 Tax=unclassified Chryseobacterium TaxID=2593645 RepID=UPI003015FA9A